MRERLDLGGNMRYRKDFLEFVKDDVHYLLIWVAELILYIFIIKHQTAKDRGSYIGMKIFISFY